MANLQRAEFIISQRGGQHVLHKGFRYRLNVKRQVATHWKCVVPGCNGRCSTIGDHIMSTTAHIHPPVENADHTRLLCRLRQRVQTDISTVQQIYNDELNQVDQVTAATMPSFASVQASLYRHRAKAIPPVPTTRAAVDLQEPWTKTQDGRDFLCVNDGDDDKILVFASTEMLDIMSEASTLFMDGTFFVCPSLWLQVYIVHCLVDNKMYPVAISLLPNKTKQTYVRLFALLKDVVRTKTGIDISPDIIQIDFESAVIKAVNEVFPTTAVRGCFFHYAQALWRHVVDRGLAMDYKNKPEVQSHVRRTSALPLLPVNQVQDAWLQLLNQSPDGERVLAFNDYVTTTWVDDDARFPCLSVRAVCKLCKLRRPNK